MDEFYRTIMGSRFFSGDIPAISKALQNIAKQLEIANELKAKELGVKDLKEYKK